MRAALKLALEALETCCAGDYSTGHVIDPSFDEDAVNEAITAIKEALVQPEQELEYCVDYHCAGDCGQPHNQQEMQTFLLAQPLQRPWVSLTDDENAICLGFNKLLALQYQETKLKEKNT